jgi:hypothetical protein
VRAAADPIHHVQQHTDFGLLEWTIADPFERQQFVCKLLPRQEMIRSVPVRDFNILQERHQTALARLEAARKNLEQQKRWVYVRFVLCKPNLTKLHGNETPRAADQPPTSVMHTI